MELPDVAVELLYDDVWNDITSDVHTRADIEVSRGRDDEANQAEPAQLRFQLNNRDGRYTPSNPVSPLYRKIGRNTPVRMRRGPADPKLLLRGIEMSYAHTPDAPQLDITGGLDMRADIEPVSWRPATFTVVAGKTSAYVLRILPAGELELAWYSSSGRTVQSSTVAVPDGSGRLAVRAMLAVSSSSYDVAFYTGSSVDGPWTQLGAVVSDASSTDIVTNDNRFEVGSVNVGQTKYSNGSTFDGYVYAVQVRDGAGAVQVDVDFTKAAPGDVSLVGDDGLTWTLSEQQASIVDPSLRFSGEVSTWPTRWDVSGTDVWMPMEAGGISRRLGQGVAPLGSALYRGVTGGNINRPVAYWPLEDGSDTASFVGEFGSEPIYPQGDVAPARFSDAPASRPIPVINGGSSLTGRVPYYYGTDYARGMCYVHFPDSLNDFGPLVTLNLTEGNLTSFLVGGTKDGDLYARAYDTGASDTAPQLVLDHVITFGILGQQGLVWIYLIQNGSDIDWQIGFAPIGKANVVSIGDGTLAGYNFGRVRSVVAGQKGKLEGHAIGHLMVLNTDDFWSIQDFATGWRGETAWQRMDRLSSEEGVPFHGYSPGVDVDIGPQGVETYLDLMSQAAEADMGLLTDARERVGLHYRDRDSFYNQAPLVVDYADLAPPLEPNVDDQSTRNDVTVRRERGSSARARQLTGPLSVRTFPFGVGAYDNEVTVNADSDQQLPDMAGWRLNLGTVDDARYPTVRIALQSSPHLAEAMRTLELGDRLRIVNLPEWVPSDTADLIVQGLTETHNEFRWELELNCTPGSPWTVAEVEDDTLGRVDTDRSALADPVNASATSMQVTSGILETFDTAPQLANGGQDQWFITTDDAYSGTHSLHSGPLPGDYDAFNAGRSEQAYFVPEGAETVTFHYKQDTGNTIENQLRVYLDYSLVAYYTGDQASWAQAGPFDVSNVDRVRLQYLKSSNQAAGDTILVDNMRFDLGPIWTTDSGEFPFDVAVGGEVVTVTGIDGSSVPQTFTVQRAQNGVTKSHSIGTDVRLAQPVIAAW